MKNIIVEKLSQEELKNRGVYDWPVWEKEASEFPWSYDSKEQCYLLEGKVKVVPDGGEPVEFGEGDFVTFPAGLNCRWKIYRDVRKHYKLG